MDVRGDNIFILNYWDREVAIRKMCARQKMRLQVTLDGDGFSYQPYSGTNQLAGYYAAYPEGVFVFFKDNLGRLLIGWKQHVIEVDRIDKVNRSVFEGVFGLLFECFDRGNNSLLKFRYHSFLRYLICPLDILEEFFQFTDIDWYYYYDLPGFIYDKIQGSENFHAIFAQLEKRKFLP